MNVAEDFQKVARRNPHKPAVIDCRSGRTLTFRELDLLSGEYARGLENYGLRAGQKTLLMVKPSPDFFALVFALFKLGSPAVVIDPGMGIDRLLHCVKHAEPQALIGVPLAQLLRVFRPTFFRSIKFAITVGKKFGWGGATLRDLHRSGKGSPMYAHIAKPDELAAILFTTGSTGPAKGVEYSHKIFCRQCELIRDIYGVTSDDIDLACYPLFALFSVGVGMTAVIPKMNPARPAQVDPEQIISPILREKCTFSFGSPALWERVGNYAAEKNIRLPSLKNVLMSGCPVPPKTHETLLRHVLNPEAQTHAPYGATEALPVCSFTGGEVLNETASATREGKGFCVGKPVEGVELRVIEWRDGAIAKIDDAKKLKVGEIGEIIVKGVHITRAYYHLPTATALAKISDGENFWHRLGDLGYVDSKGRVWFCGRAAHRVVTADGKLYSVCCEAIFNEHPRVKRSALIGLGKAPNQEPVIVIEITDALSRKERERLRQELSAIATKNPLTRTISHFEFRRSLPVDIRHNAKINREYLREIYETKNLNHREK